MTTANDMQIGGTHYKVSFEHWDWVLRYRVDYLAGNAMKYVTRWRKKGGLDDLAKAQHYVAKLLESHELVPRSNAPTPLEIVYQLGEYAKSNNLWWTEQRIVDVLTTWHCKVDLELAKAHLDNLFTWATANYESWQPKPACNP